MAVGRVFVGRQVNKFVYFYDDIPKVSLGSLDGRVSDGIARGLASRQLPCVVLLRQRHRPKWQRAVLGGDGDTAAAAATTEQLLRLGDATELKFADSTVSVAQLPPHQQQQQQQQQQPCPVCSRAIVDPSGTRMAAHMASHLELLVCGLCGHTAQRKWQLLSHQLNPHECDGGGGGRGGGGGEADEVGGVGSRRVVQHVCEHCGRGYASSRSLHTHLLSAHPVQEDCEPPTLPPEPATLPPPAAFGQRRQQQRKQQQQQCHLCGKVLSSAASLSQHLGTRHNNTTTSVDRVTCVHCDKVFSSRYHYLQHRKNVHPKYLLLCPLCPSRLCFKQKSHLRKHLETRHKEAASADVETLLTCRVAMDDESEEFD